MPLTFQNDSLFSAALHSEMPQQANGLMRGFQLWINLPASEKMSDPGYQEFSPQAFPVVQNGSATVKVLIGEYQGHHGPVKDPYTHVQYLDVTLPPDSEFVHELGVEYQGFIYVFEGDAKTDAVKLSQHSISVLGDGDDIAISAGKDGARFILVAGIPLNEPVVQYGPFVMNTQAEI